MEFETDYWIEELAEVENQDTFKPGLRGIVARLLLLLMLLWVLVQMVLPRRNLILQIDLPPKPPAEQIGPHFWA